jgi:hypothetical protein
VDTGVPAASLVTHGRLLGGPCSTTAQTDRQFNRHSDAPFIELSDFFSSDVTHKIPIRDERSLVRIPQS